MENRVDQGDFSRGSIPSNIMRLALPIIVAELVNVLYNLVDRMYIGHIPDVGTPALTGVGVALPLITLVTAFASLCGTGGAPLCAIARGQKKDGEAQAIMETAFTLLLIFAALLTAGLFVTGKGALMLMGADAQTLPYALEYFNIYIVGTIFVLISLGMNPFINAQGFSKIGMGTVLIGAGINIALDPVFIFALDMGVKGAAVATVISQFFSALWVVVFLTGKKATLRLGGLRLNGGLIRRIVALGITGFTVKLTNSATQAIVNATLRVWGGSLSTLYVGSMSIINSLQEVVSQPISGITGGAQPVMGFNFGAGKYGRVRKSIGFVLCATLAYNFLAWAVLLFIPEPLVRIFTTDQQLIRVCIPCIRIYFGAFFMMSFQMTGQNTFVALNRPKYAVFFSLLRKAILVIPLTLVLPNLGLGVNGVFYAEMISQIFGASACFVTMMLTVWRDMKYRETLAEGQRLARKPVGECDNVQGM